MRGGPPGFFISSESYLFSQNILPVPSIGSQLLLLPTTILLITVTTHITSLDLYHQPNLHNHKLLLFDQEEAYHSQVHSLALRWIWPSTVASNLGLTILVITPILVSFRIGAYLDPQEDREAFHIVDD